MKPITDAKTGDRVRRLISSARIPMDLFVVKVDDRLIHCAANANETNPGAIWTFDKELGVEEDEDLGWGKESGYTGSWLEGVLEDGDKTAGQLFLEQKAAKSGQQPPPEI